MEKRQHWDQEQRNPCCKGRGRKALVAHQMDKAKWCRNIYSYRYQRGGRGVQQRYSFHQIRWVLYGEAVPSHWRNVALLLVASWHSYSTAGSGDRSLLLFIAFVFIAKKLNSAQDCGNRHWLPSIMSLQISMFPHFLCLVSNQKHQIILNILLALS